MNDAMTLFKLNILVAMVLLSGCDPFQDNREGGAAKKIDDSSYFYSSTEKIDNISNLRTVYVPVYSHIYMSDGGALDLAITLSVRNTDIHRPLLVTAVNYYDTAGKIIENYLDKPRMLAPMASTYFFVNQTDTRGGSGANFIVQWAAEKLPNRPVIEAIMAGSRGTHAISFLTEGREINN